MKKLLVIAFILFRISVTGQTTGRGNAGISEHYFGSELKNIEYQLLRGDKDALYSLAPYLDSTKTLMENLGYHILYTPEKAIARRLLDENCSFLSTELTFSNSLSTNSFTKFLQTNFDKIQFDQDASAFVITPFSMRDTKYQFTGLTAEKKAELNANLGRLLTLNWVVENGVDKLISDKNPYALYKIAAEFYKEREHFDEYKDNASQFMDLLKILTGTEIGVEDKQHQINYHIDKEFYPDARQNLLIYFAKNYKDYKWDDNTKLFINPGIVIATPDEELKYFELLKSKDGEVAINAFIKLTTLRPERVAEIAKGYEKAGDNYDNSYSLPIFPYRFLQQLPFFTAYCQANGFEFVGSPQFQDPLNNLRKGMHFPARHKFEDSLIKTMDINDANALEYWSLVDQNKSSPLCFSAGRILDIFYSRHWKEIIADKRELNLYLEKAKLFNNLGIGGTCYIYMEKFRNAGEATIEALKNNKPNDTDLAAQNARALRIALRPHAASDSLKRTWDGNFFSSADNLEKDFNDITKSTADSADRDLKIQQLLSKISYNQIALALQLVETYKFKYKWGKYSFIERDFGFFIDDFEKPEGRSAFLTYYNSHTEKQVYEYDLKRAGIDYTTKHHEFDYDKIYELLKYDIVRSFAGGGDGSTDNEVYALIKLLEMQFNTTLGFPPKLCNSADLYGCDAAGRVKLWMKFLQNHKLLKISHQAPVSFNFESD